MAPLRLSERVPVPTHPGSQDFDTLPLGKQESVCGAGDSIGACFHGCGGGGQLAEGDRVEFSGSAARAGDQETVHLSLQNHHAAGSSVGGVACSHRQLGNSPQHGGSNEGEEVRRLSASLLKSALCFSPCKRLSQRVSPNDEEKHDAVLMAEKDVPHLGTPCLRFTQTDGQDRLSHALIHIHVDRGSHFYSILIGCLLGLFCSFVTATQLALCATFAAFASFHSRAAALQFIRVRWLQFKSVAGSQKKSCSRTGHAGTRKQVAALWPLPGLKSATMKASLSRSFLKLQPATFLHGALAHRNVMSDEAGTGQSAVGRMRPYHCTENGRLLDALRSFQSGSFPLL